MRSLLVRRLARGLVAVAGLTLLAAPNAVGAGPRGEGVARDKKAFFDVRQTPQSKLKLKVKAAKLDDSPSAALDALKDSLGVQGVLAIDPLTSTPRMVGRLDGFLTGSSGASASSIALGYVQDHAEALGLSAQALSSLRLIRDYVSIDGTHHLFYVQSINGVPVFGNGLKANVTKDGRLINIVGSPLGNLAAATSSPGISAGEAILRAKQDAGVAAVPLLGESASQVYFRTVDGTRLAYQTTIGSGTSLYSSVVDAQTGQILYRRSLVNYASGLVLDYYPNAPSGGTRSVTAFPASWFSSASPTSLTGPNVHAYSDVNDSNDAQASEETGPTGGNFNYAFTEFHPAACVPGFVCSWDPEVGNSWQTNRNQGATQLFYFINKFHDHLAAPPIGFTVAAGNFEGNDPVLGENLDGAATDGGTLPDGNHIDNANFATPTDGQSPRMQMFLWHQPHTAFPGEDPFIAANGSDEADIVYHENTHGLSNRLVVDANGNSTLGNLQAGSMGEAWSDWYAMDFLVAQGFQPDTPASGEVRIGPYVGWGNDLIRFQPLDCPPNGGGPACPGGFNGPGGFTYGDFGQILGRPEVHSDGEIWGETLWDLRTAVGSTAAESLVTRAMELSPANPSFLDMRNSILQADLVAGSGLRDTIWSVVAKRGMGFFAGSVNGDDSKPVEDFQLPPPPGSQFGKLKGTVTDRDTGLPIEDAIVAFGGHNSGFPGDLAGTSKKNGTYEVKKIVFGTYPKVFAAGPGFDTIVLDPLAIGGPITTRDFQLRRDWASLGGGGSVTAFNGPDYTVFGCGPTGAIDQSLGTGWGSDTDVNATATGRVTPKFVTIRLPVAVNITEIAVDPSNTCGDPGSSATHRYTIETSVDGASFKVVNAGVFFAANRGHLNTVTPLAADATSGIRFVRFTMVNPMVPETGNACTSPANCGDNGVPQRCGPGAPNPGNFGGCVFMDMSEIEIYGRPA